MHVYKKNTIERPEWSVERIKRHLLFQGGTESGVFEQYVTKTLEHVIIKTNKICTSTGDVDEDKRKASFVITKVVVQQLKLVQYRL